MMKRFRYSHEGVEPSDIPIDEQSMTDSMRDKTYYIEDFDKIVDLCNDMYLVYLNQNAVLHDFMEVVNKFQYYFRHENGHNDLSLKDYGDLFLLSLKARDMLENMNMMVKE